jgi:hypothetical protein
VHCKHSARQLLTIPHEYYLAGRLCCICYASLPPLPLLLPPQIREMMQQDMRAMRTIFRQMIFEKAPGARD